MWFIDASLVKNKSYYLGRAKADVATGVDINIVYGGTLFTTVLSNTEVWDEICPYLMRNKQERGEELIYIPDFAGGEELLTALRLLKKQETGFYRKPISDTPAYVQLREELFSGGSNLDKVDEGI